VTEAKDFFSCDTFFILFSRVTQRERRRSGGKSGAQRGTRCACEVGAGCAAVHPDARSNGHSVEGGVHVRARYCSPNRARQVSVNCSSGTVHRLLCNQNFSTYCES
jgi:hypothetical protein